ncbi:acetolactate synthase catalytic subunit [Actinomycetospora termitidis]|uniref:Acetolactate synthase catalytic subunit n=1 Tax=Actinomycetospora termitidis TaxID=3053470 RepID=A0ABT7M9X9_9PSEU|nr:acetolactate synthase catalytic subunit [Actinomycetospora sp. Odt1-22]MDL5156223.1 acetolactate synthase catalytic subunit [Actinomycetospora sp. Odt1-22]
MTDRTVAIALAEGLRRHGVSTVFGQSLPSALFLATPAVGIRQVAYRTENAGGAMADGYARTTGRVGVVAAQNGPAATLLVPPLAEAIKASVPILALVQDVPLANRDRNAFQEFDHRSLFASCTKWLRTLDDPERVDDLLDMALTEACSGRPGPVALLLPRDVLVRPAPSAPSRRANLGAYPLDRTVPLDDDLARAADLIASARSPLLIAGGGVHLSGAARAVAELQEQAALPVATTTMGKGAVDETHPLSVGVVSNYMGSTSASHHLRDLVADSDVVVLVGSRTNENGTDAWRALPDGATFVQIDVDSAEIGRNYESGVRLRGDARATCAALLARLRKLDLTTRSDARSGVEERIRQARAHHERDVADLIGSDAVPIRPERVAAEIDGVLADHDAVVTADASYSTIWMGNFLRARRPGQRFLAPRGLAGLGWGVPLALGAKAAAPGTTVVSLVGDGGFGHVWSELETATREDLPVVVVLLDNGILGFQKHVELVQFGEHTTATDFAPVDHSAVARACGAEAACVTEPAELAPALRKAVDSGRTWLIEVRCDPHARPPITGWAGTPEPGEPQLAEERSGAPS